VKSLQIFVRVITAHIDQIRLNKCSRGSPGIQRYHALLIAFVGRILPSFFLASSSFSLPHSHYLLSRRPNYLLIKMPNEASDV
jgi:hypothetical protein